jgi:NADH pyrophosphatase NudC (nudix superfamily)
MQLIASDSAVDLIRERGGRLYVWRKRSRCCGGGGTLATDTEAPAKLQCRRVNEDAGFELYVQATIGQLPDELHVEARRFPRRVEAYWNGCVWIV